MLQNYGVKQKTGQSVCMLVCTPDWVEVMAGCFSSKMQPENPAPDEPKKKPGR